MRLHTSVGPNPRVVKMFLAEKGITIDRVEVDLHGGENRREPYVSAVNPRGQTPALELDDGTIITEVLAICEYLEDIHPAPALIGDTPEERAQVRMWTRRVDLAICEPLTAGFRFAEGLPLFNSRMRCLPEAAAGLKAIAADGIAWLEAQLGDRPFIAGDSVSLADIHLFCFIDFGNAVGQPLDPAHRRLTAWHARMQARESG